MCDGVGGASYGQEGKKGIAKNKRCWEAGKLGGWEAFIVPILRYTLKSNFRSL